MKPAQYYLERAQEMRALAEHARGDDMKSGLLKAAESYEQLAKTAKIFGVKIKVGKPGQE